MHPIQALVDICDLSREEDEAVHLLASDALKAKTHNDLDYYLSLIQRVQRLEVALEDIYRLTCGSNLHESVDVAAIRSLVKANLPAYLFSPRRWLSNATLKDMEQADASEADWEEWEGIQAWEQCQEDYAEEINR